MEALDSWIRVGAFAVGFLGVLVFFHSILRVALLNRRQRDWLATQCRAALKREIAPTCEDHCT